MLVFGGASEESRIIGAYPSRNDHILSYGHIAHIPTQGVLEDDGFPFLVGYVHSLNGLRFKEENRTIWIGCFWGFGCHARGFESLH